MITIEPKAMQELFKQLESIDSKKAIGIYRTSVMSGMKLVQKQVQNNIGSYFKNRSLGVAEMQASIKAKFNKKKLSSNVHLFGDRYLKKSSILKVFGSSKETGRYATKIKGKRLKKARYLGYVRKYNFYSGVSDSTIYSTVENTFKKRITKHFNNN